MDIKCDNSIHMFIKQTDAQGVAAKNLTALLSRPSPRDPADLILVLCCETNQVDVIEEVLHVPNIEFAIH